MQLRLGVEGESEIPDVVASLGVEDRAAVVARLSELMIKVALAAGKRGGESYSEGIEKSRDVEAATRIA